MLKNILLASAVMISAPALAQDMPAQDTTPAQEESMQPAEPATQTPAPVEQTTTPAPETQTTTETAGQMEQAPAASGQQAANAEQIAQVVDEGFPNYDKDADGNLTGEEFGQWMVALRSASEPAFTGESTADKAWIGQALAAADTDKSGQISKEELKGFLAPAAAS